MTFLEKRMNKYGHDSDYLVYARCPYGLNLEDYEDRPCANEIRNCRDYWNRKIPEEKETYSMEEVKELLDITDEDIEEAVDAINEVGNPNPMTSEDVKQALEFSQKMIFDSDVETELEWCGDEVVGVSLVKSIKDSGERREFETGAVRDIQEGKGRCDLMPLDVISTWYYHRWEDCKVSSKESWIFWHLDKFKRDGEIKHLLDVLDSFYLRYNDIPTMLLEVAKHFEEGAKKYGENNWQKGIPTKHYIDSAIRHYLKYLRGDQDEPHDRAFVWNIMCCIWTCKNMPELNDYSRVKEE